MAKGFEGFIAIVPETKGWGSAVFTEGKYIYADSESLQLNKEYIERPDKITYGRSMKASSRVSGVQKPGGAITYQFRSDDSLHVLMSHFQQYIGTNVGAVGTALYTFVPTKGEPNWGGSAFGTGTYGAAGGDMYTVGVYKKLFNTSSNGGTNAFAFTSGVVDQLELTLTAGQDAKLVPTFKFYDVNAGTVLGTNRDPNNTVFGSYSAKSSFMSWNGTLSFAGGNLDITSIKITSKNNTEDRQVLGRKNPSKYPFGRFLISGSLELDFPKDGMKYIGSMLTNEGFSITGSLYNGANDYLTFNLPTCKYAPFEVNFAGGQSETTFSVPFVAYESEDGVTSPFTVQVGCYGWGSAFNKL